MNEHATQLFDDRSGTERDVAPESNAGPTLVDGRYRLIDSLGNGAFGVVYKAEDIWLRRLTALKVIAPTSANDERIVESLRKEALALAQIRHEHVVQIYAFGPLGRSFYLAMEYVDGKCLDTVLAETQPRRLETSRAIQILRDIGRGLGAAHACGVTHRDVKPGNIVIEHETKRAVLIDFGLARRARGSNANMQIAGGTPSYMAPEQACDLPSVGPATDIYALACTAYELFTGEPPFGSTNLEAILAAHLHRPPPPLSLWRPDLRALDPVLLKALAKDPSERYATCAAFINELERAAARLPHETPRRLLRDARGLVTSVTRILILERNLGLLRHIVRTAENALLAAGQAVEIESVATTECLVEAFESDPSDIVIIDEDEGVTVTPDLVACFRAAEVLVLRGSSSAPLRASTARELRKPMNSRVLASILTKMAVKRALYEESGITRVSDNGSG